jgi:uncharacterized RDD family membrane protein YckC
MEAFWVKRVSGIMRILSAAVDLIIVSIPVLFVMMMYFGVSGTQADLMLELLLGVYGVLMTHYNHGATLGKMIGRMMVVTTEGVRPTLVELGIRELIKSMYLIPLVGWGLALISMGMLFFGDGRTIHERASNTRVIYRWQQTEEVQDEHR